MKNEADADDVGLLLVRAIALQLPYYYHFVRPLSLPSAL